MRSRGASARAAGGQLDLPAVDPTLLPNWKTERFTCTDEEGYRLHAHYLVEPDHCPACSSTLKPYKHAPEVREFAEPPVYGKRATLVVYTDRYRCREPECRKTFMQPIPDADPDRMMTRRCVEFIYEEAVYRTIADISRMLGKEESTVRSVANQGIREFEAEYVPEAPVVLGIDEVEIGDIRRTVLVDVGSRRILDMLLDMKRERVSGWLWKLAGRRRIKIVTMDMWKDYRKAVLAVMPDAIIIVDKWHTIAKANEVLDTIRNVQRHNSGSKKNPHRGQRLLQRSRHKLTPRQELLLDGVLKNDPVINAAWKCKEAFYDIWGHDVRPSRQEAEKLFADWRATITDDIKQFRGIAEMMDRWYEETFAYFDTPFTNAYTEAANGLIKIINRFGRGYRFAAIRYRAIKMPFRGKKRVAVCEACLVQKAADDIEPVVFGGLGRPRYGQPTTMGFHFEPFFTADYCPTCSPFHADALREFTPYSTV